MKSALRALVTMLSILFCSQISLASSSNVNQRSASSNTNSVENSSVFTPNAEDKKRFKKSRRKNVLIKFTKNAEIRRAKGQNIRGLKRFKKKNKLRLNKLAKGFNRKNKHRKKRLSKSGFERWNKLELPQNIKEEDAIKMLKNDPDIEYVEPNYIQSINQSSNDTLYSRLWGMRNISAPDAWDKETGSADVIVAVIDTGVDYSHEDLKANMWRNVGEIPNNQIDDDGNGFVDDVYGYDFFNNDGDPKDDHSHGTHVAGTIGATGNNSTGVVGVNWNTRIMALKFLNGRGYGFAEDAIKAVEYAVANGAHIINASWGGRGYSQALKDAIDAANEILFVAAAGNSGQNTDEYKFYPSAYDSENILSVAATYYHNALANFSNYGVSSVDIAAPGFSIRSSVPTDGCQWYVSWWDGSLLDYCDPSGYKDYSGTSMASPHVAGAAALLKSFAPDLTVLELKQRLMNSVDTFPELTGKIGSNGRLNIVTALDNSVSDKKGIDFGFSTNTVITENSESYNAELVIENNTNSVMNFELNSSISDKRIILTFPKSIELTEYESKTIPVTIQIPGDLPKEGYQLLLTATDENNNEYHTQLLLDHDAPDFDFVFERLDRSATVGIPTDSIFKIVSNGFNGDVNLSFIQKTDGLTASFTPEVISLSADSEIEFVVTFKADDNVSYGSHRFYLQASDGNTVRKTDFALTVYAPSNDLVMDEYWIPPQTPLKIGVGNGFEVSYVESNFGIKRANQHLIGIYLSEDPVVDTSDTLIASHRASYIPPGENKTANPLLWTEKDIPSGNYYIAAIADYNNRIFEYREDNNVSPVSRIEVINDTDVIVQKLELPKSMVNAGETLSIPFTVENIGSISLNKQYQVLKDPNNFRIWRTYFASTNVDFYLSEDSTIDFNDTLLGTHIIDKAIAGGESINGSISLVIPVQNTKNGVYYIGAIVNPDKKRVESHYDNNVSTTSNFDVFMDFDLVAEKLVLDSLSINADSNIDGTFTLKNIGTTIVDKAEVGFYLSTDDVFDKNIDKYLGRNIVENMSPGSVRDIATRSYITTVNMQPGKYYLIASIDNRNLLLGETDKSNNVLVSEQIEINWDIDVSVQSVSYDTSSVQPGSRKTANVILKNLGSTQVRGWVYMDAHLSTDKVLSENDQFLSTNYVSYGLGSNREYSKTVAIDLPDTSPNNYHIIFSIKSKPDWYEKNTENNFLAGETFSIVNDVNLQITSLSTAVVNGDGSPFDVSYTTINTGSMGSSTFDINYYLSSDNIITQDDILIGNFTSPAILGGTSVTATHSLSTPNNITSGQYYLGAIVDPTNKITETNEADNTIAGPMINLLSDPDLTFSSLSVNKQKIGVGENLAISYIIENVGNSVAKSPWVYVYFGGAYVNRFTIDDLLTGQQVSRTYDLPMTYQMTKGVQELKLIVDANNAIDEAREDNNIAIIPQIELYEDVDLVVNSIDYKSENVEIDDYLSLRAEIQNIGTTNAFSAFDVSANLVNAESNLIVQVLHKERVSSLGANNSKTFFWPGVTMPSVQTGNYYIQLEIGTSNYYTENLVNNNMFDGPIFHISQHVDLIPTVLSLNSDTISLTEPFDVNFSISNNGLSSTAGKFRVGYYFSTDALIDSSDTLVGYTDMNSLASKISIDSSDTVTIPIGTKSGDYYFGIVVDDLKMEDETNEINNSLASGLISFQADANVCPTGCEFNSIQTAINATHNGGRILVGSGTYNEAVVLKYDQTLFGVDGPEATIIDASGLNNSVITHLRYSGHIEGFTIRGGNNDYGGGIRLSSGVVTIKNNIIRDNTATIGGSAVGGGYRYGTTAYLYNNIITQNISTGPSGTVSAWGIKEVRENIFSDNQVSSGSGGGISVLGNMIIDKNIFVGNSAGIGGAINTNGYSGATISNTLIANNSSGIFVSSYSSVRIINSTIADNEGTGILIRDYSSGSRLENSIVSGNSNSISTGRYSSRIEILNSITSNDIDPQFFNPTENDYRLVAGSPAIDTGAKFAPITDNSGNPLESDLDGNIRPLDGDGLGAGETGDGSDYDMGAYEFIND